MTATLTSVRIRNLALVEDLHWEPAPGLNAISGETGAGKSVILGALKLLLGERADKSLIRTGESYCTVEAEFLLHPNRAGALDQRLLESGAEPCEDSRLIIKRTITSTATRQFVNGSPVTINLLKELGDGMVDLHGPHDHQSLFAVEEQMRLLDSFAGATGLAADYTTIRSRWTKLVQEKEQNEKDAMATAREIELLRHQVREIESAALEPGEEEPLLLRLKSAANGRKIQELAAGLQALLSESEVNLGSLLADAGRLVRELERLDPSLENLAAMHEQASSSLMELERSLSSHMDSLDTDPEVLASLEERINLLHDLRRKYGSTLAEVIDFGQKASLRLGELETREERSANLDAEIETEFARLKKAAASLGKARRKAAPELARAVAEHLLELGFLQSSFEVQLVEAGEFGPHGTESVEFLFCPNPGESLRPLRQIASSGEISRVMLAVKSALAAQDAIPILVFDEIDANVGGEIATRVGHKMRELAGSHQIFCITHLPQVAAAAGEHFVVTKEVREGRSVSELKKVEKEAREEELARMLGGGGNSAREHAKALLAGAAKPSDQGKKARK